MKPKTMWIVMDESGRSLQDALGVYYPDLIPVGCCFVAAFYMRKFALKVAAKWEGARVVKVHIEEVPNA